MNCYLSATRVFVATLTLLCSQVLAVNSALAQESGAQRLRFQKPSERLARTANGKFRAPHAKQASTKARSAKKNDGALKRVSHEVVVSSVSKKTSAKKVQQVAAQVAKTERPVRRVKKAKKVAKRIDTIDRNEVISVSAKRAPVRVADYELEPISEPYFEQPSPGCACELRGEVCEPGCGICEPGCGFPEPACGLADPGCGIGEPGCGLAEPGCGMEQTACGSCVGRSGSDYWCFPVCLPRFKDLSVWAGVHGFRGPRDFSNQRSDSNFGFQEGVNISGRAPLVGLLFPQLSYQLGYQAVQSRLSGTLTSTDDRSQQFVTAGFFRRVPTGLQFGAVWDYMRDDLDINADFQQIRSEISIRSPQGREFGFWSAAHVGDYQIGGVTYRTVDQYALFYRWNFGKGTEARFWAGATGDSEGILGAEFNTPLNDRWSLQSGFNYLIPEQSAGPAGVVQESWNIGINLVWHMGRTARRGCRSPYRPMFSVADNGWMFVDQRP